MSAPRFDALIAVGDGLLLDTHAGGPGRGAASLLYRNRDPDWPDFKGRDMVSRDPSVRHLVLAQDGATIQATLTQQMKRVLMVDEPVLTLVSVGTKDFLALPDSAPESAAETFYAGLTEVFEELGRRLSDVIFFVTNIPNPTGGPDPSPTLAALNEVVREVADEQNAVLIDLETDFRGHGPDSEEPWISAQLEPTAAGANAIRRLLWKALSEL